MIKTPETIGELAVLLGQMEDETEKRHKENTDRLTGIETKQDAMDSRINGRIKSLELWRQFILGVWAVLTIITPIVWYFVLQSVNNVKEDIGNQINSAIQLNNSKYFEN